MRAQLLRFARAGVIGAWLASAMAMAAGFLLPTVPSTPPMPASIGVMTDWNYQRWYLTEPVNEALPASGGYPAIAGGELYYYGTSGASGALKDYEVRRSTARNIPPADSLGSQLQTHISPWTKVVWSNEDAKWVKRFIAPVHGSTTSADPHTPGANDKTRSELRAMVQGSVTGQSTYGEFNRDNVVEIEGTFRVRQVPTVHNGTTLVQLHPPATSRWNAAGGSGSAPSTFLLLILRSSGALECNLRLANNSNDPNTGNLITNYVVGDLFQYRMRYGPDDKIRWWFRHKGGAEQYMEFVTDSGQRFSQYGKAGVYHQAYTTQSADAGAVSGGVLADVNVTDSSIVDYIDGPRITLLSPP